MIEVNKKLVETNKKFLEYIKETTVTELLKTPDWFEIYVIKENLPETVETFYDFDLIIENIEKIMESYQDDYKTISIDAWCENGKFKTLCTIPIR